MQVCSCYYAFQLCKATVLPKVFLLKSPDSLFLCYSFGPIVWLGYINSLTWYFIYIFMEAATTWSLCFSVVVPICMISPKCFNLTYSSNEYTLWVFLHIAIPTSRCFSPGLYCTCRVVARCFLSIQLNLYFSVWDRHPNRLVYFGRVANESISMKVAIVKILIPNAARWFSMRLCSRV